MISTASLFRICLAVSVSSVVFVLLPRTTSASSYESYGVSSVVQSPYISPAAGPPSSGGGGGWGSGQGGQGAGSGSYYHYHVPLVGQHQPHHYPPQPVQTQSTDVHHQLLWLIPLLLLLLAPALLLPLLLKFLLLPIGLSLLGLLLPLLMMMGMMMMMMMGGDMMMEMRHRQPQTSVTSARGLGLMLLNDWTSIFSVASRSFDVDSCPEKMACELGGFIFPQNSSSYSVDDLSRNELMSHYFVEQLIPRGRLRKLIRNYKEAFWTGTKSTRSCSVFNCQPTIHFNIFDQQQRNDTGSASASVSDSVSDHSQDNEMSSSLKSNSVLLTVPSRLKKQKLRHRTSNPSVSLHSSSRTPTPTSTSTPTLVFNGNGNSRHFKSSHPSQTMDSSSVQEIVGEP